MVIKIKKMIVCANFDWNIAVLLHFIPQQDPEVSRLVPQ